MHVGRWGELVHEVEEEVNMYAGKIITLKWNMERNKEVLLY